MNGSISAQAHASELAALRGKYQFLTRMVLGVFILWLATVVVLFGSSAGAFQTTSAPAAASVPRADSLQIRELVVVDANGTPRVRIAAPLPDPIMLGKRFKRGDAVSGLLLYDAEGNERGGYVTGDEGRDVVLTLDEINRAAVHLGVSDRGEMHFFLSNGRGGYVGMGVQPSGAWFRLDKPGQPATLLPPPAEGAPK